MEVMYGQAVSDASTTTDGDPFATAQLFADLPPQMLVSYIAKAEVKGRVLRATGNLLFGAGSLMAGVAYVVLFREPGFLGFLALCGATLLIVEGVRQHTHAATPNLSLARLFLKYSSGKHDTRPNSR